MQMLIVLHVSIVVLDFSPPPKATVNFVPTTPFQNLQELVNVSLALQDQRSPPLPFLRLVHYVYQDSFLLMGVSVNNVLQDTLQQSPAQNIVNLVVVVKNPTLEARHVFLA